MKLESLKSKKFTQLKKEEMSKLNGGKAMAVASEYTITYTKAECKTDDTCGDCD